MSCKGKVTTADLIDFITAHPDCNVGAVSEAFPIMKIKELGARLGRMSERGEIRRVFGANGSKHYFPLVQTFTHARTLHNPRYTREIHSLFDAP